MLTAAATKSCSNANAATAISNWTHAAFLGRGPSTAERPLLGWSEWIEQRRAGMTASGTKRRLGDVRFCAACGAKADIDQRRRFMSARPKDGKALTNAHVVRGCREISVTMEGQRVGARILATDERNDLALLATNLHLSRAANWRLKVRQGVDVVVY